MATINIKLFHFTVRLRAQFVYYCKTFHCKSIQGNIKIADISTFDEILF